MIYLVTLTNILIVCIYIYTRVNNTPMGKKKGAISIWDI